MSGKGLTSCQVDDLSYVKYRTGLFSGISFQVEHRPAFIKIMGWLHHVW
jgi:hypothetical protein